jgi:hypothetical protein
MRSPAEKLVLIAYIGNNKLNIQSVLFFYLNPQSLQKVKETSYIILLLSDSFISPIPMSIFSLFGDDMFIYLKEYKFSTIKLLDMKNTLTM